ncbi:beta-L-arabinofuranosidase domain-containing protein [Butyrivibrio sp. VCB2006]|uniref:beta-L-arabinofuranosidase domain-containing protein n=1 Tax=Butyrivibrio sp. VCB2006 TaxID=1280679 RepID=UPI000428F71A|nr:beta-L-arabinofuranosidase domain-containing protein [Butyrivibrio sp. VCB2006]
MNNVHANTTIPKFIGALARYEADNSQVRYLDYAKAFWDMVIDKHTYVTGGNSENEHFGEDYVLDKERAMVFTGHLRHNDIESRPNGRDLFV